MLELKGKDVTLSADAIPDADDDPATNTRTLKQLDILPCGRAEASVLPAKRSRAVVGEPPVVMSAERLDETLLGSWVWADRGEPDALGGKPIPAVFGSATEYVAAFRPLILEEAAQGMRNSWLENAESQRLWTVKVIRVEPGYAAGQHFVRVQVELGSKQSAPPQLREGSLVVLTTLRPPGRNVRSVQQWLQQGATASPPTRRPGSAARDGKRPRSAPSPTGAGCSNGNGHGGGAASVRERGWIVSGSVHKAPWTGDDPIEATLLVNPSARPHGHASEAGLEDDEAVLLRLEEAGRPWLLTPAGNVITQQREMDALLRISNMPMGPALLRPARSAVPQVQVARNWPSEAATRSYVDYIKHEYDGSQCEAIEMSAAHVFRAPGAPDPFHADSVLLPFTLIQGPPGTGKTQTVKGILNTWHLVLFQRHYRSLVQYLARADLLMRSIEDDLDRALPPTVIPKPRILVCAPSNAATDELLERILGAGFRDCAGGLYHPDICRMGSDDAPLSDRAREVWVDLKVNELVNYDQHRWIQEHRRWRDLYNAHNHTMHLLQQQLRQLPPAAAARHDTLLAELVRRHEERDKALQEYARLLYVQGKFAGGGGWSFRDARERIEASLADQAHIVFTTLSSTGRRYFQRTKHPFPLVLIDEAAQASEVAALQALGWGCKACVMVGDPRQLPATVLSEAGRALQLERSLFERLEQSDWPVKMLSVQYRMHPEIRQWPSAHFYASGLADGESVLKRPHAPFYDHKLLKPYVFFDVTHGVHTRHGSGSLMNDAEAELAVALFKALRDFLTRRVEEAQLQGVDPPPRVSVGVITPYKQQSRHLRQRFADALGSEVAAELRIETVDSFQGKQLDVVILSCVRAAASGTGIGFVADVRRLNVAVTRARQALWILGNADTLVSNPHWADLVADAKQRGCFIGYAKAAELFPNQVLQAPAAPSTATGPPDDGLAPAAADAGRSSATRPLEQPLAVCRGSSTTNGGVATLLADASAPLQSAPAADVSDVPTDPRRRLPPPSPFPAPSAAQHVPDMPPQPRAQ